MKICFPIEHDLGLKSPVCAHFGSAPAFLVADSESGEHQVIRNDNQHHAPGMCHPLRALDGQSLDAVVVGGIGMGALMKLHAAGLRIYLAGSPTVSGNLQAWRENTLLEASPEMACGGHHAPGRPGQPHGGGCAHRHQE